MPVKCGVELVHLTKGKHSGNVALVAYDNNGNVETYPKQIVNIMA